MLHRFGILVFFTLAFSSMPLQAQIENVSAWRHPLETYEMARARSARTLRTPTFTRAVSASAAAQPFSKVDLLDLPEWHDLSDVKEAFVRVRDERFIDWTLQNQSFPRRVTWLYPDDGCFVRAALASSNLENWGWSQGLAKIFVFGNLRVKTPNHPRGEVTWWYHVVPGLRIGEQAFALDPAIDPSKPLLISEWLGSMMKISSSGTFGSSPMDAVLKPNSLSGTKSTTFDALRVAICDENTFTPFDDCNGNGLSLDFDRLVDIQKSFLRSEWQRLVDLKRDAKSELGALPPWK